MPNVLYQYGAYEGGHYSSNIEDRFMQVGFNLGNIAIARGVKESVAKNTAQELTRFSPGMAIEPSAILVVGAANWVSPFTDLSWFFEAGIESFKTVLVLGLGTQTDAADLSEISPSVKRFLAFLKERNSFIGTRDLHTLELLQGEGFDKVAWTGCPSLQIEGVTSDSTERGGIGAGGSIEVISHADCAKKLSSFEAFVIESVRNGKIERYYLQGEKEIIVAKANGDIERIASYLRDRVGIRQLRSFDVFRSFFHSSDWINSLCELKSYIGTRLHGNILAWKAGCKPFLVAHDARTRAFLRDFCFPGIDLRNLKDPNEVWEMAERADLDPFLRRHKEASEGLRSLFSAL